MRFIKRARSLGFPTKEIADLLGLWDDRGRASADVKKLARKHAQAHAIAAGPVPKGHKLDELFSALPVDMRASLEMLYGEGLEHDLASVSTAFIDWRYVYEMDSTVVSPTILINAATACHRLAMRLRSDIPVFGQTILATMDA